MSERSTSELRPAPVCMYVCMYVCVFMHTCVRLCVCVCIYVCVHVCEFFGKEWCVVLVWVITFRLPRFMPHFAAGVPKHK